MYVAGWLAGCYYVCTLGCGLWRTVKAPRDIRFVVVMTMMMVIIGRPMLFFFLSKDAATSINWVVCYVWGPHWRHPIEKGGQLVVCLQNSNLYSYWERKMSMGMILIVGMHVWHSDKQIFNFLNHLKHCWLGSISRDKRESNGLCAHIPMSGSLDLVIDKWWGPNLDFLFIAHVLLIMLQETSAELAIPESLLNLMFILFCTCPLNSAGRSVSSGEIPFSA